MRPVEAQPDNGRPRRVRRDVQVECRGGSPGGAGVDVLHHADAADEHEEPRVLLQPGHADNQACPQRGQARQSGRLGQRLGRRCRHLLQVPGAAPADEDHGVPVAVASGCNVSAHRHL